MQIRVYGEPVPQGSTRAFAVRRAGVPTGRISVVNDNPRTRSWRQHVVDAWREAWAAAQVETGPMSVSLTFLLPRPRGHYGTGRNAAQVRPGAPFAPEGRPDLDKLCRAVLDALTDAGAWRDDAQVCDIAAGKMYAPPGKLPGAVITVEPWKAEDQLAAAAGDG